MIYHCNRIIFVQTLHARISANYRVSHIRRIWDAALPRSLHYEWLNRWMTDVNFRHSSQYCKVSFALKTIYHVCIYADFHVQVFSFLWTNDKKYQTCLIFGLHVMNDENSVNVAHTCSKIFCQSKLPRQVCSCAVSLIKGLLHAACMNISSFRNKRTCTLTTIMK
jgi:hypothetical protein